MNIDYYDRSVRATGEDFNETLETVIHMTGNFESDAERIRWVRNQVYCSCTQPGVSLSLNVRGWLKGSEYTVDGTEYIEPALLAIEVFPQEFDTYGYPNVYTIIAVEIYWDYDEVDAYWELNKLKEQCFMDPLDFNADVGNIRYLYDGLTVENVRMREFYEPRIGEWFHVPGFDIVGEE